MNPLYLNEMGRLARRARESTSVFFLLFPQPKNFRRPSGGDFLKEKHPKNIFAASRRIYPQNI